MIPRRPIFLKRRVERYTRRKQCKGEGQQGEKLEKDLDEVRRAFVCDPLGPMSCCLVIHFGSSSRFLGRSDRRYRELYFSTL
jgi:hypothetical protein